MSEAYDLFNGYPPYIQERETSFQAARSVKEQTPTLRKRVLAAIRAAGGMTTDEIEERLGMKHQTASARVWELSRSGDIYDSGNKRLTRSRRPAVIWRAV